VLWDETAAVVEAVVEAADELGDVADTADVVGAMTDADCAGEDAEDVVATGALAVVEAEDSCLRTTCCEPATHDAKAAAAANMDNTLMLAIKNNKVYCWRR